MDRQTYIQIDISSVVTGDSRTEVELRSQDILWFSSNSTSGLESSVTTLLIIINDRYKNKRFIQRQTKLSGFGLGIGNHSSPTVQLFSAPKPAYPQLLRISFGLFPPLVFRSFITRILMSCDAAACDHPYPSNPPL